MRPTPSRTADQLEDGRQETLTPKQFAKKYGWKNDPERVELTRK